MFEINRYHKKFLLILPVSLLLIHLFFFTFPTVNRADLETETLFSTPEEYKKIKVVRILSTDTIELENKEKEPWTPFEQESLEYMQSLVEGRFIRLEFDTLKKGDNYETLAYAYRYEDNLFVNTEVIRQGYAYLQIQPPNLKHADLLREAYLEAKKEKRGLQAE